MPQKKHLLPHQLSFEMILILKKVYFLNMSTYFRRHETVQNYPVFCNCENIQKVCYQTQTHGKQKVEAEIDYRLLARGKPLFDKYWLIFKIHQNFLKFHQQKTLTIIFGNIKIFNTFYSSVVCAYPPPQKK